MNDPAIRQMKDFLQVFNTIAETCFHHCVNTFADRETTQEEILCLDRCVTKYLGVNHKVMEVYVQVQPEIIKKRMEEMETAAKEAEAKAARESVTTTVG